MRDGSDTPPGDVDAFIAIGTNVGDREAHMQYALAALDSLAKTSRVACSDIIETDPIGPSGQGRYLNAVVQVRTRLAPAVLLEHLLRIERERGRDRAREGRNGARTLDLDLLLYADWHIHEPGLHVPHPRMSGRSFVMEPLAQIAPAVAALHRSKAIH